MQELKQPLISNSLNSNLPDQNNIFFHNISVRLPVPPTPWSICGEEVTPPPRAAYALQNVTGIIPPGQLTAIFGPSGCGKTTLLNVIAGRKVCDGGSILHSGQVVDPNSNSWRERVGYCEQDDALSALLTPRETLFYAFLLSEGARKAGSESCQDRVDRILSVLRLNHVANRFVGNALDRGLSGGERRRLVVGIELVTLPESGAVLLVDEATSGLDSANAMRVVTALQRLAQQGHSVVCTVHQPRANLFKMFSSVMLMAQGRVVYVGNTETVLSYFGALGFQCPTFENPADFLLDVLDPPTIDEKEQCERDEDNNVPGRARNLSIYMASPEPLAGVKAMTI